MWPEQKEALGFSSSALVIIPLGKGSGNHLPLMLAYEKTGKDAAPDHSRHSLSEKMQR